MINSTLCPFCKDGIGHQMDDQHAGIGKELIDKTKALLKVLEIRFMRSGCNAAEEKALKELRRTIAKAEAN